MLNGTAFMDLGKMYPMYHLIDGKALSKDASSTFHTALKY